MLSRNGVVVVGPAGSGKSWMLSGLGLAATQARMRRLSSEGYPVTLLNPNQHMQHLLEQARETVFAGSVPVEATDAVATCEFDLRVNLNKNVLENLHSFLYPYLYHSDYASHFTVIDGPGEAVVPKRDNLAGKELELQQQALGRKAERDEMFASAKAADGLLLCLDSTNHTVANSLHLELLPFLRGLNRPTPFTRLAIALTKSERLFYERKGEPKNEAVDRAKREDPIPHLRRIIADVNIAELKDLALDIACGWVSVYGFTSDGSSNWEPTTNTMLSFQQEVNEAFRIDSWRPFRLLDPFIYLMTGQMSSLTKCRF